MNQICSTLFDYPGIRHCEQLSNYIRETVSVAWQLSTHVSTFSMDYITSDVYSGVWFFVFLVSQFSSISSNSNLLV